MSGKPASGPVLVVEDHSLIAYVMRATLESAGYEVTSASDASEALEQLRRGVRPAAVITDIDLGEGMDGWQLAGLIRAHHPRIPIVYTSGDARELVAQTEAGLHDVLQKPFSPEQLLDTLKERLSNSPRRPD